MAQDLANELLQVVKDGLKDIRDQLENLRAEILNLSKRHMQIESECQICRSAVTKDITSIISRVLLLEQFKNMQKDAEQRALTVRWTTAGKIIAALIALFGVIGTALITNYLGH